MIFNLRSSLILTISELESPSSIEEVITIISPQPTYPKLSRPEYRNTELENFIDKNNDKTELNLSGSRWNEEDMKIVAYYLLQENKVSDIVFSVSIRE